MPLESKSLVLVIGAGASDEVGLPIGNGLKSKIADTLDIRFEHGVTQISGDRLITEALRQLNNNLGFPVDINPHLYACWKIRDAMPQATSIDAYIASHASDAKIAECSKLAIARCIIEAEKNSSLYVDPSNIYNTVRFSSIDNTWYTRFFQNLASTYQVTQIASRFSDIAVISFNYDRCIEHYLHAALRNWYGVESDAASEIMSHLEIYHPYGSVGSLPWYSDGAKINYGAELSANTLVKIASGLKTFTEGTDEQNSDIVKIRSTMQNAKRVVYLGFSFLDQNLDLLFGNLDGVTHARDASIFGTTLGLSDADVRVITNELNKRVGHNSNSIYLSSVSCTDLFQHYGRALKI